MNYENIDEVLDHLCVVLSNPYRIKKQQELERDTQAQLEYMTQETSHTSSDVEQFEAALFRAMLVGDKPNKFKEPSSPEDSKQMFAIRIGLMRQQRYLETAISRMFNLRIEDRYQIHQMTQQAGFDIDRLKSTMVSIVVAQEIGREVDTVIEKLGEVHGDQEGKQLLVEALAKRVTDYRDARFYTDFIKDIIAKYVHGTEDMARQFGQSGASPFTP